jgi:hypothetical protein
MDLTNAIWRKSSYSGGNGGNCVEVASNLPGVVAVRDSKRPEDGAHVVEPAAFAALLDDIKSGRFDI